MESFTGRRRIRSTKKSVRFANSAARHLITVGGAGTIFAVLGVFLFLVWVVLPLFLPAKLSGVQSFATNWNERPLHMAVDEYQLMAWVLLPSGRIEALRLDDGEVRYSQQLFEPGELRDSAFLIDGDQAVFGLADGSLQAANIGFDVEVVGTDRLPAEVLDQLTAAPPEAAISYQDGVAQVTPTGLVRLQRLSVELGERTQVADGPVLRVAQTIRAQGPLIAAVVEGRLTDSSASEPNEDESAVGDSQTAEPATLPTPEDAAVDEPVRDTTLRLVAISGAVKSNFLTGKTSLSFEPPQEIAFEPLAAGPPDHLVISGTGSDIYVAWQDGQALRIDSTRIDNSFVAERGRLVPPGSTITALGWTLGSNTLLWGDSEGRLTGGFTLRSADCAGGDNLRVLASSTELDDDEISRTQLIRTKDLGVSKAAPLTLAPSARSRLLLAGYADGQIRLLNVTHQSELARKTLVDGEPIQLLAISPKENGLVAVTPNRMLRADLDPRYSDASFNALFRKVWYEGYPKPSHLWQSSSATDDFEPKHGLMPLIFGTLKATLYSMMFGAPLALLAAVFTSELLNSRTKAVIKPTIELMASLPSVVLGFLAALVFAPFVERVVPTVLVSFLTLPLAYLLGAYVWQLLPHDLTLRLERFRFSFLCLVTPVGMLLAIWLGPIAERLMFAGDLKGWLSWEPTTVGADHLASPVGGWAMLLLPLAALATAFLFGRLVGPWMRKMGVGWNRRGYALADVARFLIAIAVTIGLALTAAALLSALGFDPRGGLVDTYVQRNALIVGFVMGFAIIPIIYTISEDALQAVPEHLRSASLGAGATVWQTATRIVIPTATSGLFSALMIGLGRAVGETMIVLMAAGNTPVMRWNIFEGFRTLSANIAVELPEAVQGSTHYRTLFLAALVLFAMTFVVNTIAEIIRLRFRKRAYQL